MVKFEEIKFDCRLYNGYKPCIYGNECQGCPWYDPQDPAQKGWFPELTSGAIAKLPESPRVIIVKTGALGDVLRTTSLLHPLRRRFPSAHITWMTSKAALPLLQANPMIDVLTAFDGDNPPPQIHEQFDLVIGLEKEDYPLVFTGQVQAAHRVCYFPTPWATATIANEEAIYMMLLGVSDELKFHKNTHSYPQIICDATGLKFERDPYILGLTRASEESRADMHAKFALTPHPNAPVVGLNTGCGAVFRTKQWTLEGWTATARALVEQGHANVVLMGGPAETELNRAIAAEVPGLIDGGTETTLEEFFGIVDACDVIVTSDTLGMHVAIALEKHVVALFGSTSHHEIDLYDRGEKIITDFPCSPCYLRTCDKKPTCMEDMSASTVLAAVDRGIAQMESNQVS